MRLPTPDYIKEQVIKLRKDKCSAATIARTLELSDKTVRRIIRNCGDASLQFKSRGMFRPTNLKPPTALTQEERDKIVELRLAGKKIPEIEAETSRSNAVIHRVLKAAGLSKSFAPKVLSDEELSQLKADYEDGFYIKDICRTFGISDTRLKTLVNQIGAKRTFNIEPELIKTISYYYHEWFSVKEIAEKTKCKERLVEYIIQRHNITREEEQGYQMDLESVEPYPEFPETDFFELREPERKRLEEIRLAKVKRYNDLKIKDSDLFQEIYRAHKLGFSNEYIREHYNVDRETVAYAISLVDFNYTNSVQFV